MKQGHIEEPISLYKNDFFVQAETKTRIVTTAGKGISFFYHICQMKQKKSAITVSLRYLRRLR
jgi:hypothetical protein